MTTLKIRTFQNEDLDRLTCLANDREVAKNLTDQFPHPYTQAHGEAFLARVMALQPASVQAIEVEGELAGAIGIHPQGDIYCKNAELGYWLGRNYWGKGIMTEAIKRIIPYAFAHFDIERIYARPFGSNLASQRILEKNGFVLEARLEKTLFKSGNYEDELIYAVRRPVKENEHAI